MQEGLNLAKADILANPMAVVRKVSGGLDPECEEVGEQLFAFLISLLHR